MDFLSMLLSVLVLKAQATEKPSKKVETSTKVKKTADKADNEENYIKDSISGCKIYTIAFWRVKKVEWTGDCKDGYSHGKGKLTWHYINGYIDKESTTYHTRGKYGGFVTSNYYTPDGKLFIIFSGNAFEGAMHGKGQYIMVAEGITFKGNFYKGAREGYGKLTIPITKENQPNIKSYSQKNIGKKVANNYIIEGIWEDDVLATECRKSDCPKD